MSDFLDAGRHFASPNFGCLRQKGSFSTATGDYTHLGLFPGPVTPTYTLLSAAP